MNPDQLRTMIESLQKDVEALKAKSGKRLNDEKKDMRISLISSILVPIAIAASGYWFSQAIKNQDIQLTKDQAKASDSVENVRFQEQLKMSLQSQRLENYKVVSSMLGVLTSSDPMKRVLATNIILQIMPNEAPQILNIAKVTDSKNSQIYQQKIDNTLSRLIANLFSADETVRKTGANTLMVDWYKSRDIISPLLTFASNHTDNPNGIFNTVIVLQNLDGQVLKVSKVEITTFLDTVLKMNNMSKTIINAKALKKALSAM